MGKRKAICITLDEKIVDMLDEIAHLSDQKRSRVVEHILKAYLEKYEKAMKKPSQIVEEVIANAVKPRPQK